MDTTKNVTEGAVELRKAYEQPHIEVINVMNSHILSVSSEIGDVATEPGRSRYLYVDEE